MAISTHDQLIAALHASTAQHLFFYKPSISGSGGTLATNWTQSGIPGPAANPASTETLSRTSPGALYFDPPSGGNKLYLARLSNVSTTACGIYLVDRLLHTAVLDGTIGGTYTINSPPLTRYTDGEDVELLVEFYTTTVAPTATATISYTNQAGVSGRTTTFSLIAGFAATRIINVPLQGADRGIRSIESVTHTAIGAGAYSLVLHRKVCALVNDAAYLSAPLDVYQLSMAEIHQDACLTLYHSLSSTVTGGLHGMVKLIEG